MISVAAYVFLVVPLIVGAFALAAVLWAVRSAARIDGEEAAIEAPGTAGTTRSRDGIVGKATAPHYGLLKHG